MKKLRAISSLQERACKKQNGLVKGKGDIKRGEAEQQQTEMVSAHSQNSRSVYGNESSGLESCRQKKVRQTHSNKA